MSRDKRRRREPSGPPTSAGLLSFYGEVTETILKVRPELVFILAVSLIIAVIVANVFF